MNSTLTHVIEDYRKAVMLLEQVSLLNLTEQDKVAIETVFDRVSETYLRLINERQYAHVTDDSFWEGVF